MEPLVYTVTPPPQEPVVNWYVTVLAFLTRFTDEEAIKIDLASMGATVQAASMRRYISKINNAHYIDLKEPATMAGVQALEMAGILAEGRSNIILNTEPAPKEKPPAYLFVLST